MESRLSYLNTFIIHQKIMSNLLKIEQHNGSRFVKNNLSEVDKIVFAEFYFNNIL